MKNASNTLINWLLQNQSVIAADLFTFTLANGTILRMTTWDVDLQYGGHTYSSQKPFVERGSMKFEIGLSVDSFKVTVKAGVTELVNGVPFMQALKDHYFDACTFEIDRIWMPTPGDTTTLAPAVVMFIGTVGQVTVYAMHAEIEILSPLELLNVQMPKNLIQPPCIHVLYDAGCTLNRASFATSSSAIPGSTTLTIQCALATVTGYFDQGVIAFTSGANAGFSRQIQTYTPGLIRVTTRFPFPINAGDTFQVFPGCDHTQATCNSKFSNLVNFGGTPYVPVPEAVL